jgi:hypothetical protein
VAHPKPAHSLTPLKPDDSVALIIITPAFGQAKLLDMNYSSGRRFLQNGMAKRRLLTQGENNVSWSRVKQRQGFTKITPEIREKLNDWILAHPHVIQLPITNDTHLIGNRNTGVTTRVPKLLIKMSIRELHKD